MGLSYIQCVVVSPLVPLFCLCSLPMSYFALCSLCHIHLTSSHLSPHFFIPLYLVSQSLTALSTLFAPATASLWTRLQTPEPAIGEYALDTLYALFSSSLEFHKQINATLKRNFVEVGCFRLSIMRFLTFPFPTSYFLLSPSLSSYFYRIQFHHCHFIFLPVLPLGCTCNNCSLPFDRPSFSSNR